MNTEKEELTQEELDETIGKCIGKHYKQKNKGVSVRGLQAYQELAGVPYTSIYHRVYHLAAMGSIRLTRGRKQLWCTPVEE